MALAESLADDVVAADGGLRGVRQTELARRVGFDGGEVWFGDNLPVLRRMASASVRLIYIDPPFNTGKTQTRKSIRVRRADDESANIGGDSRNNANRADNARADDAKRIDENAQGAINDNGNFRADNKTKRDGEDANSGNDKTKRGGEGENFRADETKRDGDNLRCDDNLRAGRRVGFGGHSYDSVVIGETGYVDSFDDYIGFLRPRLQEAHRLLCDNGSLFFHIDWRESARCRLLLEEVFGGDAHCINELIWAYDFGGRGKTRWPAKHDNIYWFAKNPRDYIYHYDAQDRIAYMAPGLVGDAKAARGKTPTDVWWNTIVPTNGKEKTGYATQKPLAIIDRIVRVHSNPGDMVLDFFAGSGTTGIAAVNNGRKFSMIDKNPQAFAVMQKRLAAVLPIVKKTTTTKKTRRKK